MNVAIVIWRRLIKYRWRVICPVFLGSSVKMTQELFAYFCLSIKWHWSLHELGRPVLLARKRNPSLSYCYYFKLSPSLSSMVPTSVVKLVLPSNSCYYGIISKNVLKSSPLTQAEYLTPVEYLKHSLAWTFKENRSKAACVFKLPMTWYRTWKKKLQTITPTR